jgi:hypothetical protein
MTRHIKRGGTIRIRIFPDKPISQKLAEVRMGNGKGNPEYYVAEIKPAKSCTRWMAWPRIWRAKLSDSRRPSCRLRDGLRLSRGGSLRSLGTRGHARNR